MGEKPLLVLFVIIGILISCTDSKTLASEKVLDESYVPKNLNEALTQIDFQLSDSLKIEIKKKSESDFIGEVHFGLGLGIRNNWRLWKGSDLSKYFNDIGIYHPDDMSSIILVSYYRKLIGIEIELEAQVAYYQEYWDGVELTRLPEKSEYPEPNTEFRVSIGYKSSIKNRKWPTVYLQTNSKTENFWIYDYYYGWKKIDLETKQKLEDFKTKDIESILNKIFD
ncbi:hypothetical protein H2O64_09065 [Kordia sp. YSTF-M3]|uniref:DUF6794 domain-containing protein n=1 Tax=Kordia aestuariivivens TaxID=2759037 RepID=A0ABR7Q917_9FLAO|nr:DUF6794 domain-containing protein [Kordia aestuariivivens]MBC8754819.1 hypothetical protein [Kordia aestuariivivens]